MEGWRVQLHDPGPVFVPRMPPRTLDDERSRELSDAFELGWPE